MSSENNSEVAVDKVPEDAAADPKSDLKGTKRPAEVSAHVATRYPAPFYRTPCELYLDYYVLCRRVSYTPRYRVLFRYKS